jgi:hypothetical protein
MGSCFVLVERRSSSWLIVLTNITRTSSSSSPYVNWILSSVSAIRVVQIALILLLLLFRRYLGISRSNVVFGIALGFGLFALANLLIVGVIRFVGVTGVIPGQINSLAYLVASVIWLIYMARGSTPCLDEISVKPTGGI